MNLPTFSFAPHYLSGESAWAAHIPFGYDVVKVLRPKLLVELGTWWGDSFFGFCQAVKECELETVCYAVDHWEGDDQAGSAPEHQFERVEAHRAAHYPEFAHLLRARFDAAAREFADESIDLLHMDGHHTYESASKDFETWKPKLRQGGVVLLHDIAVRANESNQGFGVWRLWGELKTQHKTFEFRHGYGLGILMVGENPEVEQMLAAATHFPLERYYSRRGVDFVQNAAGLIRLRREYETLTQKNEALFSERDALASANHVLAGERDALAGERDALAGERDALAGERDALAGERDALAGERDALAAERDAVAGERDALARACDSQAETIGILNRELHRIKENPSWTLTQPLRDMSALMRTSCRTIAADFGRFGARLAGRPPERAVPELFDHLFYLAQTGEPLGTSRAAAWGHYQDRGWREGLKPHPLFDGRWYLETNRDVAESGVEPLQHYLAHGQREGRRMSPTDVGKTAKPHPTERRVAPGFARCGGRNGSRLQGDGPLTVYYLSGDPSGPGHSYRVQRPVRDLCKRGYHADWSSVASLHRDWPKIYPSDVMILWRVEWSDAIANAVKCFRGRGGIVVFDLDDLMVDPTLATAEFIDAIRFAPHNPASISRRFQFIAQTLAHADYGLAPTKSLAMEMQRVSGKPVHVLPNGFDEAFYRNSRRARAERREGAEDGLIRIGYAGGTRTHQKDFAVIVPALDQLLSCHPEARLVLFQDAKGEPMVEIAEFPQLARHARKVEWRTVVPLDQLPFEYARFDINVAPLEIGNRFCEAKSELKYFEAALVETVTIASPTQPFADAITDGVNGFLAKDGDEWLKQLTRVVKDPAIRRNVARNAFHHALHRHGPERRGDLLDLCLRQWSGDDLLKAQSAEIEIKRSVETWTPLTIPDYTIHFAHGRRARAEVAVIISLFNYEKFIEQTLDSVHAQTLGDLELVVVDDQSTDRSFELAAAWLEAHAPRFTRAVLLRNRTNSGLAATRNAAIAESDAPYVFVLDADNLLFPECLSTLHESLSTSPFAFAYSTIEMFGNCTGKLSDFPWDVPRLRFGNYVDAMSMIRRSTLAAVGGFVCDSSLPMGWEDYHLWCKCAESGLPGLKVEKTLARYRVHGDSMIHTITSVLRNVMRLHASYGRRFPWLMLPDLKPSSTKSDPNGSSDQQ